MRKTEEMPRICIGVDLHKLQFTVGIFISDRIFMSLQKQM